MTYKLGCYSTDGSLECLRTINGKEDEAKERARLAYNLLKETYGLSTDDVEEMEAIVDF